MADTRPVYLNLFKIRLPVTGIVSLAHRITGVLIFLSLPVCVWLLERSVVSANGYEYVMALFDEVPVRLALLVLVCSLAHHFFAVIRFLLLDIHVGVDKQASRRYAWLVIIAELVTLAAVAGAML